MREQEINDGIIIIIIIETSHSRLISILPTHNSIIMKIVGYIAELIIHLILLFKLLE